MAGTVVQIGYGIMQQGKRTLPLPHRMAISDGYLSDIKRGVLNGTLEFPSFFFALVPPRIRIQRCRAVDGMFLSFPFVPVETHLEPVIFLARHRQHLSAIPNLVPFCVEARTRCAWRCGTTLHRLYDTCGHCYHPLSVLECAYLNTELGDCQAPVHRLSSAYSMAHRH